MAKPLHTLRAIGQEPLRRRGRDVGRLEGFSDAVFGFAVTLLVMSLTVPHDYAGLMALVSRLPAFVATFLVLFVVWLQHYRFFRFYGLEDGPTMAWTVLLLVTVVAYLYPLKFLSDAAFGYLVPGAPMVHLDLAQAAHVLAFFDVGFAAIFLALAGLHHHARRRAADLELGDEEIVHTRFLARQYALVSACAGLSALLAGVLPARAADFTWAVLPYGLLGPGGGLNVWLSWRARRALVNAGGAAAPS